MRSDERLGTTTGLLLVLSLYIHTLSASMHHSTAVEVRLWGFTVARWLP